jgi:hypothetical protein
MLRTAGIKGQRELRRNRNAVSSHCGARVPRALPPGRRDACTTKRLEPDHEPPRRPRSLLPTARLSSPKPAYRESNRSRPHIGITQHMNLPSLPNDRTRRGDGQLVLPFAGEDLGAREEFLRQTRAPRIVLAERPQRHDGQTLLPRLKTKIRPIQMKPQFRVESQPRIAAHDQQQLYESRTRRGYRDAWPRRSSPA